jgi:hypothetical protein
MAMAVRMSSPAMTKNSRMMADAKVAVSAILRLSLLA